MCLFGVLLSEERARIDDNITQNHEKANINSAWAGFFVENSENASLRNY
jgi:hypothetical protein